MPGKLAARLLATALVLAPVAFVETAPHAVAQSFSISFEYFHDELAPYGRWYHHPRWGDVWRPLRVQADFRPYYRGHWDYTRRYGWVWQSDYEWGDIPFHYGRWVYDPYDGWLWVPGYVWSPAWVVWRSTDRYVGWFPMPPDERFLAGDEVYRTDWNDWDRGFGYADWYGPSYGANWLLRFTTFVDERHFADRDWNRYVAPPNELPTIARNARNVTNYVTINNYIVNRSVDVGRIERSSGRRIEPVPEQQIVRTNIPIVAANEGRQIQQRERRQHGGDPNASPRARVAELPANGAAAPADQRGQDRLRGRNGPDNNAGPNTRVEEHDRANAERNNRNQPRAEANAPSGPNAGPQDRGQRNRADEQRAQAQDRAQAERDRANGRAQNDRAQREQADREQAQRAQQEQRAQAERDRAQNERSQRAQAERDQAQQRQNERAQNEQAQREQAQQAQREQAQQAQREQAQQRAQNEREQAQQRAQNDRAQAQREQAQAQREQAQAQRQQAQQAQREQAPQAPREQPQQRAQPDKAQPENQANNERGRGRRKQEEK